ncbi:SAV_915 family protein [Streptomyces boninensis]|uniref:SAV_915 family protein n=1 Tax=Streptomyces boninensis TaxID=2039455 RepID=UPI003B2151A5
MSQPLLYVPVHSGPGGGCAMRMFRTPLGTRTAVAFTSEAALGRVLGPAQPWIRIAESALQALALPLGADRITVDPLLTARRPRPVAPAAPGEPAKRPVVAC